MIPEIGTQVLKRRLYFAERILCVRFSDTTQAASITDTI